MRVSFMSQTSDGAVNQSFALITGAGFILWMLVFFLAAVGTASAATLVILLLIGAFLFFSGIISWLVHQQPFRTFDDINQPVEEESH